MNYSVLEGGETLDWDLIDPAIDRIDASPSDFDKRWMEHYRILKAKVYAIRDGDLNQYQREASSLMKEFERQNARRQNDKYEEDRKFVMNQLKYEWNKVQEKKKKELSDPAVIARRERNAEEQLWMDMYSKIKTVYEKHGKILYSNKEKILDIWTAEQRQLLHDTKLSNARIQLLEELGIEWIRNEDDADEAATWGEICDEYDSDFERMTDAHVLALGCEENLFCNLVFADEPGEEDGAEASGHLPHREDGHEDPVVEAEDTGFLYRTESSAAGKENVNASETVSGLNASANEMAKAGNDAHSSKT